MGILRYSIGNATLVRIPYADVLVDAEVLGLTPEDIVAVEWSTPTWAEGAQVRAGAAVWVIESDGRRIVVDPAQAADDILRGQDARFHQEAVATALADAGYPRESIDTVIATHVDGIGMIAWRTDDGWAPFFPNADVLVSRRERDAIVDQDTYQPSGAEAFLALCEQGVVVTVDDEHVVTPSVTTEWTGIHSPGHLLVHTMAGGDTATMLGHLALSPLFLDIDATGPHLDPTGADAALRALGDGRLLIGPLWPAPGAVRWTTAGGSRITPAESSRSDSV
jgi:hypothetical protein